MAPLRLPADRLLISSGVDSSPRHVERSMRRPDRFANSEYGMNIIAGAYFHNNTHHSDSKQHQDQLRSTLDSPKLPFDTGLQNMCLYGAYTLNNSTDAEDVTTSSQSASGLERTPKLFRVPPTLPGPQPLCLRSIK